MAYDGQWALRMPARCTNPNTTTWLTGDSS